MRFVKVAVNSVILNLLVYFTTIEISFTLTKVLLGVTRMKYMNLNLNHISDIYKKLKDFILVEIKWKGCK